jgi:TatD-related deoxyribonuclease
MLENGKWTGPIFDQHMHLDRSYRFLDAVSDFSKSGGTGLMLVHKPAFSQSLPSDINEYREAYSETISMAEEIRRNHDLDVGVVLGPHPVAWENQIAEFGLEKSSELHLQAVDLALEYIDSGDAHCLGEVGRPHYPVGEETWNKANEMLLEILSMASSENASVQLHVEDNDKKTCSELSQICRSSGLPLDRAIRHYAPPDVSSDFTYGLSATVNVGKGSIESLTETASMASAPWGMETDYLDDRNRPGAVLGPKTVPKRTHELSSSLLSSGWTNFEVESLLTKIHSEWPRSLYGI